MVASEDAPEHNEHLFNSREFARDSVTISADVCERRGGRFRVSVIDLSRSGFRMHSASFVEQGKTVFLTIPGFEQLEAKVAWHDKEFYGCAFSKRLHIAVYDHIKTAHPSLSSHD